MHDFLPSHVTYTTHLIWDPQNIEGLVILENVIMIMLDLCHPQNLHTAEFCTYSTLKAVHYNAKMFQNIKIRLTNILKLTIVVIHGRDCSMKHKRLIECGFITLHNSFMCMVAACMLWSSTQYVHGCM